MSLHSRHTKPRFIYTQNLLRLSQWFLKSSSNHIYVEKKTSLVPLNENGAVETLTRRVSNLRNTSRMCTNQSGTSRCYFEQKTLHSLLSTG